MTGLDMSTHVNRLIALDFDGTSAVYDPQLAMHSGVMDELERLLHKGFSWVINSDRFTDTMIEVAERLPSGLRPDAIMSAQRFIHVRSNDNGYEPLREWNESRMDLHRSLWQDMSLYFEQLQQRIEAEFTIRDRVVNDIVFAYMVPAEENAALRACMEDYIRPWPNAKLSGNHEWSFILHADFSKAALLEHYCAMRGIEPQKIIAIGDGFNDISMLDAALTPHTGCPADASPDVIAAVRTGGGYVARGSGPEGTIEVLRYYQGLPAGC
jgi:hydroxymethylpyrimidine pyrophosphatase-like HAD family hydrolase